MKLKKLTSMILALGLVAAMSGCGSDTTTSENTTPPDDTQAAQTQGGAADLKIGVVMKSYDEFQQSVMDGAKDAAIELGVKESNITMVAPNNESDIMAQVTMVEDLVSKNVDVLVLAVNQEETLLNAMKVAKEQGVQIVFADTQAESFEGAVTYVGTDNKSAAYEGALEFCKTLAPNSNVVILRGKLGDVNHESRTQGLTEAIEESGHTVLEVQDANCETDRAASVMESWLTKFPNQVDAVMVTSDSMAVGAAQAVKGAGLSDQIQICGFDGFQSAISLIPSGDISMIIAQKPYDIGYKAAKCGIEATQGASFEPYMNPGIAMIDETNYAEFLK